MKIYTQKQINQIKNQALNKIYWALKELYERDVQHDGSGAIKDRHDELLDIALDYLNRKPSGNVYGWINKAELKGSFLN